ncbi:MAG TPA: MarR family transcriptional regulator [Candidatus Acidoferrales bacterium]|nr:MarR family transcriptional regulator [Candidatus Acidoferrales bacterium]
MPTHYNGTADEERALCAFINFMRSADSLVARLDAQIEMSGLTHGQFAVLETLLHLGPLNQCDLARKLLRSGGNVTIVIDNLEKRGLVRRERQTEDRRMVVVSLTSAGRRLIACIFPKHAAAITAEMSRLSSEEQDTLRALCRKLGTANLGNPLTAEPKAKTSAPVRN